MKRVTGLRGLESILKKQKGGRNSFDEGEQVWPFSVLAKPHHPHLYNEIDRLTG